MTNKTETGLRFYDYNRQCWIEGKPARALALKTYRDDLELLRSYRGADYAHMTGRGRDEMIAECEAAIAEWER